MAKLTDFYGGTVFKIDGEKIRDFYGKIIYKVDGYIPQSRLLLLLACLDNGDV